MPELQIENKEIKVEEITKKIYTVENKIKDDYTYENEDSYKILTDIFELRNSMSVNLNNIVEKIGRYDIVEAFQRITIAAEMEIINELNDRLNEMLKLATYLAETTTIGAIAGYLELKEMEKQKEVQTFKAKLSLDKQAKDIIKIYKKYLKKDWKELSKMLGIEEKSLIERYIKNNIADQGELLILEYKIYKALKKDDEDKLKKLLEKYSELTKLRAIKIFLLKGVKAKEIVQLFKESFRIIRIIR